MHDVQRGYEDTFIMLHEDQLAALMGGKLRPVHLAVYVALLRRANRKRGNSCFPSLNTIAKEAGVSRSTVKEVTKDLVDSGLVRVIPRKSEEGDATSNLYVILRPATSGGQCRPGDDQGGPSESPRVGQEMTDGVGRQMPPNQMKSEPEESEPDTDADASEPVTKASNKRANDAEIALIDAYCEASGNGFPTAAGKAINMAKVLVKAGRTPEEVRGCVEWLLADPWHATKGIAFETIVKHIDNYRQVIARQGGARPEPATLEDRFGRHVDAVAASAVPRRGKPQVIY